MESQRLRAVQSPVIPDVAALIRAHPGTLSLGQGVVHYPPPAAALSAAGHLGADATAHHYRGVFGEPELIGALERKLAAENGIPTDSDRFIMVTAGSNMAFSHCVLAIADPGDEIIMMAPFYFNHEMAAVMANVRPVFVQTDAGYQPVPERIAAAITPRTRAVVTISPNNPAGVVYDPSRLTAINGLCRERGLYHICDEAYEYFTYEGAPHFSPGSLRDSAGHTISLFSFSKAYGMASWRVGYAVVPEHLRRAMAKIQDTALICPPVVCQTSALAALEAGPEYCRRYLPDMDQVRRLFLERLGTLGPRCRLPRSDGAFYLLATLDCSLSAMELVEALISRYGVAVIPGTAFGVTDSCCVRIAYGALSRETAARGMDRLITGLHRLLDDSG